MAHHLKAAGRTVLEMRTRITTGIRQTRERLVQRLRTRRRRAASASEADYYEGPTTDEEILPPMRTYYFTRKGNEDEMDNEIYIEQEPERRTKIIRKRSKSSAAIFSTVIRSPYEVHNPKVGDPNDYPTHEKQTRLQKLLRIKPRELTEAELRIEKVKAWQKSLAPRPFIGPIPPILETVGITARQTLVLSRAVNEAIAPTHRVIDFSAGSEVKPFLMVHQTNEFEIMTTIGSYRLNTFVRAKRDMEGACFSRAGGQLAQNIHDICDNERHRRTFAYKRTNKSLTLEEAYEIATGKKSNNQFGIVEIVTSMQKKVTCINMHPVVHSEEPVIGVPFKSYFKDIVDIPEYPVELLQAMNKFLDKFAIQVIDLRARSEEIICHVPAYMNNYQAGREVVDAIVRSVDALNSIRHTAKYFVVYAFYNCQLPMRFYQAVIRFKPGLPVPQTDWLNTRSSRNMIDEPDPDCTPLHEREPFLAGAYKP